MGAELLGGVASRDAEGKARGEAWDVLVLAAWCALAAGLLEDARHAIWHYGFDRLVWMSADVWWMAPAAYLLLFAIPALVLAALARGWPRLVPLWLPAFVFAAAGSFGVLALLAKQRISWWALGLVALAIGTRVAAVVRNRPDTTLRLVRRSGVMLAGLTALLLAWSLGGGALRERLAMGGLPAAPAGAPNVLFIILDTVRGDNLSLYGYHRPTTPNLERLAEQSVVFDHAMAPAPWTLPSHATAFTGRWPHELSVDWQVPLDGEPLTLAEWFRGRGYLTAGFVANLIYTSRDAGLGRGFSHYRDHPRSVRQLLLSASLGQQLKAWDMHRVTYYPRFDRPLAAEISRAFLDWSDRHRDRPFFAFLNYYDAHQPYLAPAAIRQRYRSGNSSLDSYDAAITHLDQELGLLFDELAGRGVLDHTIVVVAGDHGQQFGEHGLKEHGNSLYEPVLRVPLLIRYPAAVPPGRRIATFVSLRSLPATLTDLTGGPASFPGRSLANLWSDRGQPSARQVLAEVSRGVRTLPVDPVTRGPMRSLFSEPYHYIRNGDGREELYDYLRDPNELRNLALESEGQAALIRIRDSLDRMMQTSSLAAARTLANSSDRAP